MSSAFVPAKATRTRSTTAFSLVRNSAEVPGVSRVCQIAFGTERNLAKADGLVVIDADHNPTSVFDSGSDETGRNRRSISTSCRLTAVGHDQHQRKHNPLFPAVPRAAVTVVTFHSFLCGVECRSHMRVL